MKRKKPKKITPQNCKQRQNEIYKRLLTTLDLASSNGKGAVFMYPKRKHPDYFQAMQLLNIDGKLEGFNYQIGKLDDEGTVICLKFTPVNNSD